MKAPWYKPWARKRAPAQSKAMQTRQDGWQSALMGYGMKGRDKRVDAQFIAEPVTDIEARELWRGNDIAKKTIEVIPEEMFRQGWTLAMDDKEQSEDIMARCEELSVTAKLQEAKQYERAYGGAAIMPSINDGQDLSMPLAENRIMRISGLTVFEPRELSPATYYDDPRSEKYGEPRTWRLVPLTGRLANMHEIHESRLIIFPGIRVTREDIHGALAGWGDSVLTSMQQVLRDFGLSWEAAGTLVTDFAQAIFKVKNLAGIFAADKDDAFYKRMQALDMSRSVLRAFLIDAEEDYERKATPVTGLPELLDRFMTRMSAASDLPVTRLFGISPAGMNATGKSDQNFMYDRVSAQWTKLRPLHERLVKLIMLDRSGPTRGVEPEMYSVAYNSLYQQTDEEKASARKTQAETDKIYIETGVVSPEEIALARFGGDTYSYETTIDFQARRLLEPPVPQLEAPDDDGDADGEGQEATSMDYRTDYIEEVGGDWVVFSKSGEIIGVHETEEEALAQLRAVEANT